MDFKLTPEQKDLQERARKFTREYITPVANELEKITTSAMHLTSFALVDKKQGFERMKAYSNDSNLSTSVIQKAIDLAIRINPLLEHLA